MQVGAVTYDREGVANHAKNLASTVRGNLRKSLEAIGVVRRREGVGSASWTALTSLSL